MSYKLEVAKTGSTPYIMIDEDKGYVRFEGESLDENPGSFYADVNRWLESYLKSDFEILTFDCELKSLGNPTAELLLDMMMKMDAGVTDDREITVNWITTEDNEIIIGHGEDLQNKMRRLRFNLIKKKQRPTDGKSW